MSEIKAFGIPIVIKRVLENLTVNDLLKCRLVAVLWNTEASKILQRQLSTTIMSISDLASFNQLFESAIDRVSMKPSRFTINLDRDILQIDRCQEEMERFFKVAGRHVTKLRVEKVSEIGISLLVAMIYTHFPNLSTLSIGFENVFENSATGSAQLSLDAVLDLPNLKHLYLNYSYRFDALMKPMKDIGEFLSFTKLVVSSAINLESVTLNVSFTLSTLLQPKKILEQAVISSLVSPHLKQISLNYEPLSGENLSSIATHSVHFPLDTVNIVIKHSTEGLAALKQFLNKYRNTLRKLHLDFSNSFEVCFPPSVLMSKLRYLDLEHFEGSLDWEKLPELKQVRLLNSVLHGKTDEPSKNLKPSLDYLKIWGNAQIQCNYPEMLTKVLGPCLFSNLISLSVCDIFMTSMTASIQLIFSECKHLRRLELSHCKGLMDETLCGMEKSELEIIFRKAHENAVDVHANSDSYWKRIVEQAKATDSSSARLLPYIGNLTNLQYLNLAVYKDTGTFSDHAVLYGIIHCKRLRKLELHAPLGCLVNSAKIIQQAGLEHLTNVKINFECLQI